MYVHKFKKYVFALSCTKCNGSNLSSVEPPVDDRGVLRRTRTWWCHSCGHESVFHRIGYQGFSRRK